MTYPGNNRRMGKYFIIWSLKIYTLHLKVIKSGRRRW
jgi:hypothetical protein